MNTESERPTKRINTFETRHLRAGLRLATIVTALADLCIGSASPALAQTNASVSHGVLETVHVTGKFPSLHDVASESDLVGPANQPEWTTRRAFAETDIYVIPTGEIEFNQFYILSNPRQGKPEHQFESEFEFGLPWRTQFDVELNYSLDSQLGYDSTFVELPHALADWGRLPLNPAIVGGWRFNNDKAIHIMYSSWVACWEHGFRELGTIQWYE